MSSLPASVRDVLVVFAQLRPALKLLFAAPKPSAIMAMLAFDGRISPEVWMPITPIHDELRKRLVQACVVLQALRAELPIAVA